MEREMDSFIDKEKEPERRKWCVQLRKIGVCEVMKDKEMEDGIQHRDDQSSLKENSEERMHDTKWVDEWSLCNKKRHDV